MIQVYLVGELGKEYGRIHKFDIKTARDIFDALSANFRGFRQRWMQYRRQGYEYYFMHGTKLMPKSDLLRPLKDYVVVVPRLRLADPVSMMAVFAAISAATAAVMTEMAIATFLTLTVAEWTTMAIMFAIGGVLALMAPSAKMPDGLGDVATVESATSSFYAGGDYRLSSGSPMPFGYGTMLVSGTNISTITTTIAT
jgi:predicted phage tail protein